MSFVTTQPEMLSAAAADLQGVGSVVSSANAAAAGPTTGVVPAAADEVSALTAAQFAAHAQVYQAVSAQAAGFTRCLCTPWPLVPVRMRSPRPPTRSRPVNCRHPYAVAR
ncbi:hypothetical protein MBRA_28450 [Mycobacterium branderi]|uniref:PE domain-containing protein n=1 Tax=Mycobacterium branderi TaxID=43348 RepID=A0ABM7KNE9_9MYCO|nr:hypothetical protein MBRA_28450 [Mycobacterium branderi]